MVSIFSFGLLSLHILKKYAILSLEKAVLATFWASSLGGPESAIRSSENLETDGLMFLGPLGTQINIKLRMYMKIKLNYISDYTNREVWHQSVPKEALCNFTNIENEN